MNKTSIIVETINKNCINCNKMFDIPESIFCCLECAFESTEQKFQNKKFD